jgi:hypothetical protein
MSGDLLPVDLQDMIIEAKQEARMKRDVYGRMCQQGTMNRRRANRKIDVQDAIVRLLEGIRDGRPLDELLSH